MERQETGWSGPPGSMSPWQAGGLRAPLPHERPGAGNGETGKVGDIGKTIAGPLMTGRAAAACVPPEVSACSFELDIQWILDIIDKISETLRKIGEITNKVFDIIGEVLAALKGIVDLIAWVPGLGDVSKKFIREMCDVAGDAAEFVYNIQAEVVQFTKHATAPWQIRSAGRSINQDIVPQTQQFNESLNPSNFSSNTTWKGKAADKFRANLEKQYEYATTLAEGTAEFGSVVENMGEEGVKTTIEFVQGFFKATGALIQAIYKVWAVPVGTAVAAKDVINLVMAIIDMIQVWVEMIEAVASQTMQLRSASQNAAPDSKWPAIAS